MYKAVSLIAVAAAALTATAADAAFYSFDLSGSRTAHFILQDGDPDFSSVYQTQFRRVSGTFGGVRETTATVSFGALSFISALDISNTPLGFTQFAGPILFTGPTSDPMFIPGTYALSGIVSGNSTLRIAATVPEPTIAMLALVGAGLGGIALRRRGGGTTERA